MSTTKIPLSLVEVASPCTASWDAMSGDDTVRFCGQCSRHVYNLSEMTAEAALALIAEHQGAICKRYYLRSDGTILTADCPVGLTTKRAALTRCLLAGALIVFAVLTLGVFTLATAAPAEVPRRHPVVRAWYWLFPEKTKTVCVMGD